MRNWKALALASVITILLTIPSSTPAQVSINIGPEPGCPYGYYDYAPYNCAPYGYYGPEWFSGGVFIGAGPWFHVLTTFTATLITILTPIMGTMAHSRTVATRPLITSTETKSVMAADTCRPEDARNNR